MRLFIFSLTLVIFSIHIYAQSPLSGICNLPRQGDQLVKQRIAYQAPGDQGTSILWDFSQQEILEKHYELKYTALSSSDIIIGTEHQTMYYYHSSGDSLQLLGYENPTTLIKYRNPESILVFPLFYGRTFIDYFDGIGRYCDHMNIHIQGKSIVMADAEGRLVLPDGDTLKHVLRVHTLKKFVEHMSPSSTNVILRDTLPFITNCDSIEFHLKNDSIHMEVDTWRWYAEGYRYPIFETIKSITYKQEKAYEHFATSFYYPLNEQYYGLNNDSENQTKRDKFMQQIANTKDYSSNQLYSDSYKDEIINYHYSLNEQGLLQINYTLIQDTEIMITLYDIQGRQLSNQQKVFKPQGSYQENIPLSKYTKGEYLLQIKLGDKIIGEKVLIK